jgi:hypothetical protein
VIHRMTATATGAQPDADPIGAAVERAYAP